MPRLPRLRVRALDDLAKQLRYESPDAARRQLDRAEALALELLESGADANTPSAYPEAWIVFRITGLRTDASSGVPRRGSRSAKAASGDDATELLVREALIGDLGAFIDRLSAHAKISESDLRASPGPLGREWVDIQGACERLGVSRKTLERLRRTGLISRRISFGKGRERAMFSVRLLTLFAQRAAKGKERAARFSRVEGDAAARIVARARELQGESGWSLTRCARAIGVELARSPETIRRVLRAHDKNAAAPVFGSARRELSREVKARLVAAARSGSRASAQAKSVDRGRSTLYRLLNDERVARLRALDLSGPVGPMFEHPDADQVMLSSPLVRTKLGRSSTLALEAIVRDAAGIGPTTASAERTIAGAYCFLRWRAARAIADLPRSAQGAGRRLDRIETDLLWASRLKAELVRTLLPLFVRSINERVPGGVLTLPRDQHGAIASAGIDALAHSVDQFDPFKGGRLAAPAGVALGRALSRLSVSSVHAGGAALHEPTVVGSMPRASKRSASIDLAPPMDWTRQVSPWQRELDLVLPGLLASSASSESSASSSSLSLPAVLSALPPMQGRVVTLRFGLSGGAPMSAAEIAKELSKPDAAITLTLRRAVRALVVSTPGRDAVRSARS